MERIARGSARLKARVAGALYLISIVARIIADGFVRERVTVAGNPAATAANLLAHQTLFQWGFVADIAAFASYVALAAVLYDLLKPVNRTVSLIAAFFSLVASIVQAFSSAFHLGAMVAVAPPQYLHVFTTEQLQALALLLLRLRAIAYHNVGLVFLGLYCITLGYLIVRSTFLPRLVGVLIALAGFAYLPFLSPQLARSLMPYILIPAGLGQIALTLWLLFMGVDPGRWSEAESALTLPPLS